jgi:hypothetical protein
MAFVKKMVFFRFQVQRFRGSGVRYENIGLSAED